MDVMVQWEQEPGDRPAIARVRSVASPETAEQPQRDVVTLYGQPTPESLALAGPISRISIPCAAE